jgi:hypothetical protein
MIAGALPLSVATSDDVGRAVGACEPVRVIWSVHLGGAVRHGDGFGDAVTVWGRNSGVVCVDKAGSAHV